ncbi:hypothetical protein [Bradyrhizobium japonicum]|uniref:hypothetical protein n=1 Tax=Bradyrhizobium japonicum TaxID=375 RepID=UPI001B8A1DDA|nr:hypothetical protein [Bradyrhizobium japonicum]MBR0969328.1 hypothetical protein [Bradyrhizobium japonicum]
MVPAASHAHDHSHAHSHGHDHTHAHVHDAAVPHPAQAAPWSILRMTMAARVAAALAACAVLWGVVFLAMR